MKKLKLIKLVATVSFFIILSMVTVSGCSSGEGGGFDVVKFLKNPIIMGIIFIATLYFVFKSSRKGKG